MATVKHRVILLTLMRCVLCVSSEELFADTYKTPKACHSDIVDVQSRMEKYFDTVPPIPTEPPKRDAVIYFQASWLDSFCDIGYIQRIVMAPNWPTGKPWEQRTGSGLWSSEIRLQLQKSLPDFPVFVSAKDIPQSFHKEWMVDYTKKNGQFAKGGTFLCTSWIEGKATGGGISTAIRAHLLKCKLGESEFSRLGLIEDEKFDDQFKAQLNSIVDEFVESWNLVKRH